MAEKKQDQDVDAMLDRLLKGRSPEEVVGSGGLLEDLTKRLLERALEGELTDHLGYEKHAEEGRNRGNSRNGRTRKRVRTDTAEMEIEVPRDRDGSFEPKLVPKGQRRLPGFDEKVIALYVRGMTTREIQGHLKELYKVEVSPSLISTVTDAVLDDMKAWQSRPPDRTARGRPALAVGSGRPPSHRSRPLRPAPARGRRDLERLSRRPEGPGLGRRLRTSCPAAHRHDPLAHPAPSRVDRATESARTPCLTGRTHGPHSRRASRRGRAMPVGSPIPLNTLPTRRPLMVGCADRPARTLSVASALLFPLVLVSPLYAQDSPPPPDRDLPFATHDYPGPRHRDVLIPAGTETGLPRVVTHDNRSTAGRVDDGVRIVELEVQRADWRIESDAGPGLRVAAIGEVGGVPMVPAPLIRAETGMRIRVILHNRLEAPLQVYGLYDRPEEVDDSTFTVPGSQTVEVEFEAGPVGTYIYSMWEGELPDFDDEEAFVPERDQMAGALIVDPVGGGGEDRILVMNIFGEPVAETVHPDGYLEALTINGRTWPYTDLLEMEVGTTERWRVINATGRNHPMHLHGFYFDVLSKGTTGADRIYSPEERRSVVTETMRFYSTMVMDFTPTRPGRWIFHCHLTFHVAAGIRLPGAREADPEHAESHMSGLVMGIDVAPGPTDLIARGEPVEVDLYAKRYGDETGRRFGFDVSPGPPTASADDTPGPLLIFNQYQPADVTVHNELGEPTGVHWHGLELDAWADGVPNWTASDGRVSPAIQPGEAFTYRLSLMRPGTFMYHTHLNDLEQLSGGLYGPLIVLPPGETFDPEHDHPRIFAWRAIRPGGLTDFELNGRNELDDAVTRVGETHRFRLMNIGLANAVQGRVFRDGEPVPIRLLAKDGADLPASQQIEAMASHRIFVGETSDFLWTPTEPGEYMVWIGIGPPHESPGSAQRWTVLAGSPETAGGN